MSCAFFAEERYDGTITRQISFLAARKTGLSAAKPFICNAKFLSAPIKYFSLFNTLNQPAYRFNAVV